MRDSPACPPLMLNMSGHPAVQATYYSQPNSPTTFACASNNKAPTTTLPSVALAAGGAFGWQSDFSACNMCLKMRGTGSGIGNSPVTTRECWPGAMPPAVCMHARRSSCVVYCLAV